MDVDIEKIHNILIEACLPSSINDLKNPTEDFVVNLMNTFLTRFHIDASVLDKPTIEEQDVMSYCIDSDTVGLINLHVAMVQICDRIFCKGLCITDITVPGSKKVRKQAKFLANFILYATNKESDIEDKICEIRNKAKLLHDTIERGNKMLETINDTALYTSKLLSTKEKIVLDIKKVQSNLEQNNKQYVELMARMAEAEERKQESVERCGIYRPETLKLSKVVAELQSEIVESPENYRARLSELEKLESYQDKEREATVETIQDKKHLIEQKTECLAFAQKQLNELTVVRDVCNQLRKVSEKDESVSRQVDILKAACATLEGRLESQKDKFTEINDIHEQNKERLSHLRNMNNQLLSNKKLLRGKLEEVQSERNEDSLKLKKTQSMIKKLEEETAALIRNCQDVYDKEIKTAQTSENFLK